MNSPINTITCGIAPWTYEYSPYQLADGTELPAFEIFDADGHKLFDTHEDSPAGQQEANAQLAAAAPSLHQALVECLRLLADHDASEGEEGEIYRRGLAVLSQCPFIPLSEDSP